MKAPIEQRIDAIDRLHAQDHLLPCCFFSGPTQTQNCNNFLDITSGNGNGNENGNGNGHNRRAYRTLVSVAGVASAVFFKQLHPFSYTDWMSIKRFLSRECPLIRAYGGSRFDAKSNVSSEWEAFGSFFFMVPQVEFDEFEHNSMLAATIAWDDALSWPWRKAINELQAIICQISSTVLKLRKEAPRTFILSNNNITSKKNWDLAVNRALQKISRSDSELTKVVLARSSRVVTAADVDPITWLACLQVEVQNAYRFCLQPHDAPAFIGNTPKQLFRRKWLNIESDAMARTCARGESMIADLQVELDPLSRLRSEDDEFEILSLLHPTPAVCGFPTNEARLLIAETEILDRGMYAGPVGWFGGVESEFAVGIRSALVEKGVGALIYAGTGIVEGSEVSLEWDVLELKVSQYTKLLKLEVPPRKKDC